MRPSLLRLLPFRLRRTAPIETVSEPDRVAVSGARWRPANVLTAAYLAVTALPLASGGAAGARALVLALHVGALALIVAAERVRRSPAAPRWARPVADLHVLLLIPALYAELPMVMQATAAGVVYHDPAIQAVERAVFGFEPAWELAGRYPLTWLSELVHLAYLLYYPIVLAPPLWLYASYSRARAAAETASSGRISTVVESEFAFERATLALTLSMLSCYLVFVLWPVQGPRYISAPQGVPSGPIRALVLTILEGGSSRGAAFPSSHVAVAVTQSLVLLRYRRRWGVVVTGVSALLSVGAVYGGFHYAIDALVGAVVGVAAWFLSGAQRRAFANGPPGFAPVRGPV